MVGATFTDVAVRDWWASGVGPLARVTGVGTSGVMGMGVVTGCGGDTWQEGK